MICTLLRKPLTGTIIQTLTEFGGGMNIDASRVGTTGGTREIPTWTFRDDHVFKGKDLRVCSTESLSLGRFPANLILIPSDAILSQFPYTESGSAAPGGHVRNTDKSRGCYGKFVGQRVEGSVLYGDAGSSARFFKAVAQ